MSNNFDLLVSSNNRQRDLGQPANSKAPFCCRSGCISTSSALSPSSSSALLLLTFRDLLFANSPIPAEANLWACNSGVPVALPTALCAARDFVKPEDSRDRLGGTFAGALGLRFRTVNNQTAYISALAYDMSDTVWARTPWSTCNAHTLRQARQAHQVKGCPMVQTGQERTMGNSGDLWKSTFLARKQPLPAPKDCKHSKCTGTPVCLCSLSELSNAFLSETWLPMQIGV